MTVTPYDIRQWVLEAKENLEKLDKCRGPHVFVPMTEGQTGTAAQRVLDALDKPRPAKNYQCTKCGGCIGNQAYYWYQRGLMHGRIRRTEED